MSDGERTGDSLMDTESRERQRSERRRKMRSPSGKDGKSNKVPKSANQTTKNSQVNIDHDKMQGDVDENEDYQK